MGKLSYSNNIKPAIICLAIQLILLCVLPNHINAQSFVVSKIETDEFPILRTTFVARDKDNHDYSTITPEDFLIVDNGDTIESKYITVDCDDNIPVHIVFLLDFSTSVVDGDLATWIKNGIYQFLELYPLKGGSEAALITFADTAFIALDFTSDIDKLKYYSSHHASSGNTNYNDAFKKAISQLINGPAHYPKYVIMMSDGKHMVPGLSLDSQGIIKGIDTNGIVLFGIQMISKGSDLQYLANKSGGYFYYAANEASLPSIMDDIADKLKGDKRCKLSWLNLKRTCHDTVTYHDVSIKFLKNNLSVLINYYMPLFKYIPSVKFKSIKYYLGAFLAGTKNNITIQKALINYGEFPIILNELTLTGPMSSDFNLVEDYKNRNILPGDSLNIIIQFTPADYGERTCDLNAIIDCADTNTIILKGNGICGVDAVTNKDFGEVELKNSVIDTIVCAIQNLSSKELILTPRISGEAQNDYSFKIIGLPESTYENIVLPGYGCFDIEVKFTPSKEGARNANIHYYIFNGCEANNTELNGIGTIPGLQISSYDWGKRRIKGKYEGTVTIYNPTPIQYELTNLDFESNDYESFAFTNSDFPILIPPDSSLSIPVLFNPEDEINYSGNIKAVINNGVKILFADLKGSGFLPKLDIQTFCGKPIKFGDSANVKLIITNHSSSSPLSIDRILLDKSEYFWKDVQNVNNIIIDTNSSLTLQIVFKPKKSDNHECQINIYADNYDSLFPDPWKINTVSMDCPVLNLEYINPSNFGPVLPCDEFTSNIKIKNLSKSENLILYLSKANFDDYEGKFSLISNDDIQLAPLCDTVIPIIFYPLKPGISEDVLNIPNSFKIPINVNLRGESIEISPYTEQKIYQVNVGEEFTFPVHALLKETNPEYISNISISVNYNPKSIVIKPESFRESLTSKLSENENWIWGNPEFKPGSLMLSGSGRLNTPFDHEFYRVNFYAVLTEYPNTNVIANMDYGCFKGEIEISEFIINPVCIQNSRYIEITTTRFGIESIAPSPANSTLTIEFGVGFDAETSVKIFNTLGNQEYDLVNGILKTGKYSLDLDCSKLSSGVYFLKFNSGSYSETKKFLISK